VAIIETAHEPLTVDRPVPRLADLFPGQGDWTEDDYFALPEVPRVIELADGRLEIHDMPTYTHQRCLGKLYVQLDQYLARQPLGVVCMAPLPVRLWPRRIREPDLVFMAAAHADRIADQAWGVPDLVVEIHSPSTVKLDQETKRLEYAQAGIAEYWMVDTDARWITVYVLADTDYSFHGRFGVGDTLASPLLPGFAPDLGMVFGDG